ncbi:MAG TPA: UDP-N-acetylglucosamine--N-acetylmuramyl-(pentapeptide) pyrophosphoryl-undecaprenol N-acetylglucosamine transferase [Candidatus Saccharimonadales bacterium]|nr:UDP-N-acetylglucosamine--N-acetylmuramyl-(pentapeptide) pyrophosphoryl-undecaprenol N-acetylglucosamine transferase [Candidatus Saccharimonadales bacterium]
MTIVLTGGGSGGHITPILAVAHELKNQSPDTRIVYIGQKGDKLIEVIDSSEHVDEIHAIRAGKFRRYHNEGLRQWLSLKTWWLNLRDSLFVLVGIWQSWRLLKKLNAKAVFVKGGYVGLPVGLAAGLRRIPYVTHDSDSVPGLTNRTIAKRASYHAVAMPVEVYKYPKSKTVFTGVPIVREYKKVTPRSRQEYRRGLGIPTDAKVITVTGGGLGAEQLNQAVVKISKQLFNQYPNLFLVHLAGSKHDKSVLDLYAKELTNEQRKRLMVKGFINDLYRYSAAADLVITRAGATALAEFALQECACVVVPNPALTGGHQTKNAKILADKQAIKLIDENMLKSNPGLLYTAIRGLLDFSEKRFELARRLGSYAKPQAASELAKLILSVVRGEKSAI